jgi:hypothetical protein
LANRGRPCMVASFHAGFRREGSNKPEARIGVGYGALRIRRYVSLCEDEGIDKSSTISDAEPGADDATPSLA